LINSGIDPSNIVASTKTRESAREVKEMKVNVTFDNFALINQADIIIIALKPFVVLENAELLKNIPHEKVLVSIAAFVPLSFYKKIANVNEVYRAMPNVNVEINKGFTALCGEKSESSNIVEELFSLLGEIEWVSEEVLDKLTLMSASSPALVVELIDAFEIAAMYMGIPQNIARKAILNVFIGTAELASKKDLLSIRNSIITPKGITSKLMRRYINANVKSSIIETFIQASEDLEQIIAKLRLDYKI
jgi:pyrroline-5-carboxylate reductase